jgi:hypothetical protein
MANIIIKDETRRQHESYVLDSFRKGGGATTAADRDAAETIAARSREAYNQLKQMEGKKNG